MTLLIRKKINAVAHLYDIGDIVSFEKVDGGLINRTYKVCANSGCQYIFQELHTMFNSDLVNDAVLVSDHLNKFGWRCSSFLRARHGNKYINYKSRIWRVYKYIEGFGLNKKCLDEETCYSIGGLLGILHRDLKLLQYVPSYKISGFHNSSFYINKSDCVRPMIYDKKMLSILDKVIKYIKFFSGNILTDKQLIHGDPRIENILFSEDGIPKTFIDFDTLMTGSVSIDVGDCLRSLMLFSDGPKFTNRVRCFIDGYREVNLNSEIDYDGAVVSLKYISLELTLKFLIDMVEQSYFSWNSKIYKSAADHNRVRALQCWKLFNQINKQL